MSEAVNITAAKFEALLEIAREGTRAPTDLRLAVLLLAEYYNAERGFAWPSRERLADELGVDKSTVTRALKRLEKRNYFAVTRNKGRGHTNRCVPAFAATEAFNGEKGASVPPFNGQKRAHPRTEKGAPVQHEPFYEPFEKETSVATATESKKFAGAGKFDRPKGNTNENSNAKRATRLAPDWRPSDEDREFARGLGLDPEHVGDQFRDFWIAKAGKDGVKLDWPATWRVWCRRETEWGHRIRPNGDGIAAAARRFVDGQKRKPVVVGGPRGNGDRVAAAQGGYGGGEVRTYDCADSS